MLTDVRSVAARRPSQTRAVVVTAVLLAVLALGWLAAVPPAHAATRTMEKGVSFCGYWKDSYDGSGPRTALRQLRATGATWAMVLVTVYQANVESTTISRAEPNTPTDASLLGIIAYAHTIGLRVMLKPQLDFLNDPAHCRSQIGPDFSDADWATWFASYDETIVHYAKLAADAKCEQLSVGCELDSTVSHEAAWRQVIADVRSVYTGKLTYAADPIRVGPQVVTWWDAVDLIGEDTYPNLSGRLHPTVAQLVAGWRAYYAALFKVHVRWHKPVIFTEVGVRSLAGAASAPWDWQRSGAVDLVVQQRWYRAALQTFAARSWMKGLFLWQWSTYPSAGGPHDGSYTPHGKPAAVVLRSWFTDRLR